MKHGLSGMDNTNHAGISAQLIRESKLGSKTMIIDDVP